MVNSSGRPFIVGPGVSQKIGVFLGEILSGKITRENSRKILRDFFFLVSVQTSFPWSHPHSSRRNLDIPVPSKKFPRKCNISRIFPFPCHKIPWKYRFPKPRANQNCCKKNNSRGNYSSDFSVHGISMCTERLYDTRTYQVRMIWYGLFRKAYSFSVMFLYDTRTAVRGSEQHKTIICHFLRPRMKLAACVGVFSYSAVTNSELRGIQTLQGKCFRIYQVIRCNDTRYLRSDFARL